MLPLLLPLVSTVVPEMAKWLFPSNPKADTAIQAVSGVVQAVTGGDPTSAAGIAAIGATLAGNPELGTQLQQKLLELHASMQAEADQASTAALAAQLADVANARQQVVALAQARSPIQWASPVVSIVVTLGFFVVLWLLLSGRTADLPAPVMQIVTMIVGTLVAGFATVINFWLGSSQGSKSKDGTIAAAQTALANSTPTPQQ